MEVFDAHLSPESTSISAAPDSSSQDINREMSLELIGALCILVIAFVVGYFTLGYVSNLCRCLCSPYADEKEGFSEIDWDEDDYDEDEESVDDMGISEIITVAENTKHHNMHNVHVITMENKLMFV